MMKTKGKSAQIISIGCSLPPKFGDLERLRRTVGLPEVIRRKWSNVKRLFQEPAQGVSYSVYANNLHDMFYHLFGNITEYGYIISSEYLHLYLYIYTYNFIHL